MRLIDLTMFKLTRDKQPMVAFLLFVHGDDSPIEFRKGLKQAQTIVSDALEAAQQKPGISSGAQPKEKP